MHKAVCVEQMTPVAWQGAAIGTQRFAYHLLNLLRPELCINLFDGHDQRRIADYTNLTVDFVGEFGRRFQPVLGTSLCHRPLEFHDGVGSGRVAPSSDYARCVEARVPDIQVSHTGELSDRLAI